MPQGLQEELLPYGIGDKVWSARLGGVWMGEARGFFMLNGDPNLYCVVQSPSGVWIGDACKEVHPITQK